MTTYLFQSHSYPTQWKMHQAIAKTWLTADGLNDTETVREVLDSNRNEQIAVEAESEWELHDLEGFGRAELIDALQELREQAAAKANEEAAR